MSISSWKMSMEFNWIRPGYELVKGNFTWNILVPFLHTKDGDEEYLYSPYFSPQETPTSKWNLEVYNWKTQISIIAYHCNSAGARVNFVEPALVELSIFNRKGGKVLQQMLPSASPCFVKFKLSKEDVIKSDCQQADGSLTFYCKILTHVKKLLVDPPCAIIDCIGGLSNHLEGLFKNMHFSDVNFNIGGRDFPAHKSILAARSQVFAAMFQHPTKENLTNKIEIEDMEPEVFDQLLRFIYTGRVQLDKLETMAAGLFIAADKYLLDDLKRTCENHMLRHMSPDNCVVLLLLSDLHNPTEPLKEAAKFFRRLPSQVMATVGWEKMEEKNPRQLCQIHKFLLTLKK